MHQHTLSVGDTQTFIFEPTAVGGFWMAIKERILNRYDRSLLSLPGDPQA
jgi:hypothetical protein